MFQNAKQMFYVDNTTVIEKVYTTGEVNTTYSLTLVNAAPTLSKTYILFYCASEDPVDTVMLDLIGKQKHHNVCMCRKNIFPYINPLARSKLASKAIYCTLVGGDVDCSRVIYR